MKSSNGWPGEGEGGGGLLSEVDGSGGVAPQWTNHTPTQLSTYHIITQSHLRTQPRIPPPHLRQPWLGKLRLGCPQTPGQGGALSTFWL